MADFDPHAAGAFKPRISSSPNKEPETSNNFDPRKEGAQPYLPGGSAIAHPMLREFLDIPASRPEDIPNRLRGIGQGIENVFKGYLNLLPGVNLPRSNVMQGPEARKGEMISEMGSYFLPSGISKAAFQAASKIPMIGNALKSAITGLESKPLLNAIAKLGKSTGEGALSTAVLAPKEEQGKAATTGGGIALGTNLIAQLYKLHNPVLNALLRGVVGGGAGYVGGEMAGQDPWKSAGTTALLSAAGPRAAKMAGIGRLPAGYETLEHLTHPSLEHPETMIALNASKRLKRPISPAEASGNEYVGGLQGGYGRVGEGAALKTEIGLQNVLKERNAYYDLLETIYDKSPEANKKIADLYKKSLGWNLKSEVLEKLKQDPVIEEAFNRVKSESAYRRKLANVPENNAAYLNQVKRALDDMEKVAKKKGEGVVAGEYADARQSLLNMMDKIMPSYKAARDEAQKKIIRRNIEKKMKKHELKGSSVHDVLLKNETEFRELHDSLSNVPEAQDKLLDIQSAFKNLINVGKPRGKAHLAETGVSQARQIANYLIDTWNEMTGSKRNIAALKFINSGEWDKAFTRISEMKDDVKRRDAMADLVAKLTTAKMGRESQGRD